ncbi:hypothetical protein GCM10011571_01040 [Marinithermofilum abyssi]|jgi:hypothetical protein|uniref:Tetratricopeptide repeat-containing protein n=1 Tax=Marinithermofilum abyssi TaxID=1571185 RepID=A0A8J2VDY3_9BACL|nr:hypothetical protein [Marinithermofilum abyssi]GGE03913.1 hypothetical protein GCM10011571_01040 [Marinithermofilum abyssi]
MKKWWRNLGIGLMAVALIYGWVWLEMYRTSQVYFDMAMASYEKGEYGSALKGMEMVGEDGQTELNGGFQQVVDAWREPYAWPRPAIYSEAQKKADTIIEEKLTIEEGEALFKSYFNRDNTYLSRIMLRVGEMYEERRDFRGAKETYKLVTEAFAMDKDVSGTAKARLSKLP